LRNMINNLYLKYEIKMKLKSELKRINESGKCDHVCRQKYEIKLNSGAVQQRVD